jgi:hypothetical protein
MLDLRRTLQKAYVFLLKMVQRRNNLVAGPTSSKPTPAAKLPAYNTKPHQPAPLTFAQCVQNISVTERPSLGRPAAPELGATPKLIF